MHTILNRSRGNTTETFYPDLNPRSTRLSLRSAGLWTTWNLYHAGIIFFSSLANAQFITLFIYLSIYSSLEMCNRSVNAQFSSFYIMALKLQHSFTSIFAGPSSCGKSNVLKYITGVQGVVCDIVLKMYFGIIVIITLRIGWKVSFVKSVPEIKNTRKCTRTNRVLWFDGLCPSYKSKRILYQRTALSSHFSVSH